MTMETTAFQSGRDHIKLNLSFLVIYLGVYLSFLFALLAAFYLGPRSFFGTDASFAYGRLGACRVAGLEGTARCTG